MYITHIWLFEIPRCTTFFIIKSIILLLTSRCRWTIATIADVFVFACALDGIIISLQELMNIIRTRSRRCVSVSVPHPCIIGILRSERKKHIIKKIVRYFSVYNKIYVGTLYIYSSAEGVWQRREVQRRRRRRRGRARWLRVWSAVLESFARFPVRTQKTEVENAGLSK